MPSLQPSGPIRLLLTVALLVAAGCFASARAAIPLQPQINVTGYVIHVDLDPATGKLSATAAVTFTALEDLNRKNYLVRQVGNGQAMSYEGLDPAHGVPGLYWITLFSRSFASWLGIRKSITGSGLISEIPAGFMLRFSETPDSCQSEETLNVQKCLISELGERRFFDIHRPLRS